MNQYFLHLAKSFDVPVEEVTIVIVKDLGNHNELEPIYKEDAEKLLKAISSLPIGTLKYFQIMFNEY